MNASPVRNVPSRLSVRMVPRGVKLRTASHRYLAVSAIVLTGAAMFALSGCYVQDKKSGQAENVRLQTPIGGLDVRTNSVHGADVGLPVYPGAMEVHQHGDDSGSADINMHFGDWRLRVKAVEYHSSDPEDKILDFYKKSMAQYGGVLTCKDETPIGQPTKTQQGLTCNNGHEYQMTLNLNTSKHSIDIRTPTADIKGNVKLLAGSPQNQHMVEVQPESNGTKFALVVVQLPHKGQTD